MLSRQNSQSKDIVLIKLTCIHSKVHRVDWSIPYLVHCACWYRLIRILWFWSTILHIMINSTCTTVAIVSRAITEAVPIVSLILWNPRTVILCEALNQIWPRFYTNSPQM
jgi:hypothetical protein